MKRALAGSLIGVLALVTLALGPAAAAPPAEGVIDPGHGIGPTALGMTVDDLVQLLGKEDFKIENDDGSLLYEWVLLTSEDVPDALLWAVIAGPNVVKLGTDAGLYRTSSGLRVGSAAEEFVKEFGQPASHPAPDAYVFRQGIGISVLSNGSVGSVWIQPAVGQ